jgi:hypothetical protein
MEQLINQVYEVFGKYEKPFDFVACECCISPDEKSSLLSTPLRDLSADQLRGYAADAFFTMADVADFKYFLPRILELCVQDKFFWPYPEVVTRKLMLANWLDWPTVEQVAVSDPLEAKFDAVLNEPNNDGSEIDKWLCALGRCLPDLTPCLAPLLRSQHQDKLLALIEYNGSLFTKAKLDNPFWKDASENEQRVVRWLHQPSVTRLLSERYGMIF